MNDDQKSFLKDVFNSEGWKIIKRSFEEKILASRQMATTRDATTEERWWHAGEASGVEDLLQEIEDMVK